MKKFFKRFLPVLLVFALAFGSVAPVQAAESYKQVDFVARNYWDDGAGYTEYIVSLKLPVGASIYGIRHSDADTGAAANVRHIELVVVHESDSGWTNFEGSWSEIMWKYGSVIGENYTMPDMFVVDNEHMLELLYDDMQSIDDKPVYGWGARINQYKFPFPMFSSVQGFIDYLESGDTSGIENWDDIMVGPTLPDDAPDQSIDDILSDIWGDVSDEEVIYEEDDGTVLGAIRTAFKNIVNGIVSPIRTLKQYIKLLPGAFMGVLMNSKLGKWVEGVYTAALAIPGAILDAFLQSDFVKWIKGIYTAALGIPVAILDAFLQSDFVTWIKGIYTAALGIPVAIVNNITDKLEYWFVPSVDDWKRHFKNYDAFCSEKLGLLYYPYDVFRDLMAAYIAVDSNSKLTVPGYSMSIGGNVYTIWESLEVDMDQLDVFKYVRMFTSFLQVCGLWKLAGDKWEDWIAEGRH